MTERESVQPAELPQPSWPLANVVVSGDLVFVSGQPAFGKTLEIIPGDFRDQARAVLTNIGHCLRAAGCGFEDVVKVNAYVTEREYLPILREIFDEYFPPPYPAATAVLSGLGLIDMMIEVDVIARRPSSGT